MQQMYGMQSVQQNMQGMHGVQGNGGVRRTVSPPVSMDLSNNAVDWQLLKLPRPTDFFIDEDSYFLGAGDILQAMVWGVRETLLNISITNNEIAIIPTVGAVNVSGLTLREAKQQILELIQREYRARSVDIFVARVKEIPVQVLGQVNNPGTHVVMGNLALSSVIELVGGANLKANLREVQLIHPRHGTRIVDVVASERIMGQPSVSLRNGDVIFVPQRDLQVMINGDILHTGIYDFVEGDKLLDLIAISGGMFSSADSSAISITRTIGNNRDSIKTITVNFDNAANFALQRDDVVMVPRRAEFRPVRQVQISGEVVFPGTYVIQENHTRLIDVIQMAGGFTNDAFLGASRIVRRNFVHTAATEERKQIAIQSGIQITPSENNFLRFTTANETRISMNFAEIKDDNSIKNLLLRENDEIVIERNDWTVNVMGAVLRPGFVDFAEGRDVNFYIAQAGGLRSEAMQRQIKVIKAGTQNRISLRDVQKIERGDIIWVPERDFVSQQERQQNVAIRGGIWGIVGSIATTLTAAVTVMMFIQSQ
ncbi:MAG: SLBB domain-containing protein [Chitinivibrionia bacterium]|nr:SLBB domain-containing protein [Chitinivibrionia bacterium]